MAGGRRIPITVEADTKGDFNEAARGLDDVAKSGDDAEKSLGKLTKGHQALDAEINKTAHSVKNLRSEFERTGDIGLLKDAKKLDNARKGLEKLRTEFDLLHKSSSKFNKDGGLLNFALDEFVGKTAKAAGGAILTGVESGIQGAGKMAASNPLIAGGIAAGITLGLPLIGGAMAAAVGGAVIAGGILLAAKDPRVGAAWGALGESAKGQLTGAASVFVDPLVRGAKTFGDTFDRIMPNIRADFDRMAPIADKLFTGVAGMIEKMMPGIDALTKAAGPVLTDLANELPKLGAALSQMFSDMAAGGAGGAQALRDMLTSIEISLVSIGKLVWALEKWYLAERAIISLTTGDMSGAVQRMAQVMGYTTEQITPIAPIVAGAFRHVSAAIGEVGASSGATSELASRVGIATQMAGLGARIAKVDFATLSAAIADTGSTTDRLAGAMTDQLMGTMLGMSHATLGVQSGLLNLKDTFDQNGKAIDWHTGLVSMNTKAGIANRESVLSAIEGNLRMYDAQINSGVGADVATAKYEQNTKALHDQLREAGLTEQQVSDLIGEYGKVPAKVSTALAMQGLTDAINNLGTLLQQLLGLPTHKTITIDQIINRIDNGNIVPGTGGMRIQRWGGAYEHAQVGLLRDPAIYSAVSSGARYAFAEPATGGEAFIPKNGDPGRSMGILSQAASWYDASVVPNRQSGYASPVMARGGGTGGGGYVSADAIGEAVARRVGPTINVHPPAGASTAEIVAEVKRELAWEMS